MPRLQERTVLQPRVEAANDARMLAPPQDADFLKALAALVAVGNFKHDDFLQRNKGAGGHMPCAEHA